MSKEHSDRGGLVLVLEVEAAVLRWAYDFASSVVVCVGGNSPCGGRSIYPDGGEGSTESWET